MHGELQELYRAAYPYYWHKLNTGEIPATCLRSTPRVEIRRKRAVEARIYKNQNSLLRSSLFVASGRELYLLFANRE